MWDREKGRERVWIKFSISKIWSENNVFFKIDNWEKVQTNNFNKFNREVFRKIKIKENILNELMMINDEISKLSAVGIYFPKTNDLNLNFGLG